MSTIGFVGTITCAGGVLFVIQWAGVRLGRALSNAVAELIASPTLQAILKFWRSFPE